MRLFVLPALAIFALGACATPSISPPKVCDGRNRRPANPNGITLPMPVYSDSAEPSGSASAEVNVFETPTKPAVSAELGEATPIVPAIALSDGEPS